MSSLNLLNIVEQIQEFGSVMVQIKMAPTILQTTRSHVMMAELHIVGWDIGCIRRREYLLL